MLTQATVANTGNMGLCEIAISRALNRDSGLPGLVCFYGPSGFGKSVAAGLVSIRRRAYYVQAKSFWSRKAFLLAILKEMSIHPAKTIPEIAEQVAAELANSQRPLIIDEMDHIIDKNYVELVRDLYEASQTPILLIGEEGMPSKLRRWERFHGRVLAWIQAQPCDLTDAKKLAAVYCPKVTVSDDLLARIVEVSRGSARRISVNLSLVQETALTEGMGEATLLSWGSRTFYSGEAPKVRRFE